MKSADFDFHLPQSLIALEPAPERDASRLLVLGPDGTVEHRRFSEITRYLAPGDMLLLNRTKVLPVRLSGVKPTGGRLEFVLVREVRHGLWEILCRGKYTGSLEVSGRLRAEIREGRTAELLHDGDLEEILWEVGAMPLPPYIKRKPAEADKSRYQTVYASAAGSIAAPTAGLHFTQGLLKEISDKGVLVRYLTLHVGKGTFMPVRADDLEDHAMEAEYFEVERDLVEEIGSLAGRLFAVGTTTTRAIEGLLGGKFQPAGNGGGPIRGRTDIFIRPGHTFRAVRGLVTNFHLPRSTPLMLASALAGRERLLRAYAEAVRERYRFFSYGDAMLIL
ncbi:MAG: tRNA preQ1(34) S-adenosylmethionine ribosyltransferase-isomerase QueA [Thermodesulfovibrionales bacterium]